MPGRINESLASCEEGGLVHLWHREGGLRQHLALPLHLLYNHHQLDEDDQQDDQPTCKIGQELNNVHQIPVFGAGEAADWPCSSPGGTAQSSLSFLFSLDFYM